jgi:phosphatidylinositol alpha-1,6-mannosyltransferase
MLLVDSDYVIIFMRKSLFVTYFFPPKIGGIENYLFNICKRLPKDKIVVLADMSLRGSPDSGRERSFRYARDKTGNLAGGVFDDPRRWAKGFRIYRTRFFAWKFFKPSWLPLIWKIWKIIKKERIEILQFGHYAHYCLIGTIFKKLFNCKILRSIVHYHITEYSSGAKFKFFKVLIYIHGVDLWIHQQGSFWRWLMKLNLKNADKIIANSYFMKGEILKLGIEEERVVVVHPGVDYKKFQIPNNKLQINPKFQILNCRQNFESHFDMIRKLQNKKVILSLGRLIRLKGYDLVLKALPEVVKKVPNLIYLIVGEGETENELKDLTKKLNLKKYVIFAGAVKGSEEARAPYYALADVFVGPSREIQHKNYKHVESFGIAYLEAQAAGKPVIATRIGGIPEAVLDNQTGILIPPDNPKALAQALIKLLTDEELARQLGEQGRERVKREFDWEKQVGKIVKILDFI